MSFIPIDFENEPSEKTPVSAENLNYMQQGIVLAVDRSRLLDEAWKNGSLKGDKGDRGAQGERGLQGAQGIQGVNGEMGGKGEKGETGAQGLQGIDGAQGERGLKGDKGDAGDRGLRGEKGADGTNFHIDGTVALLADLPNPSTVPNQWWVSYEFGHLHHSDGVLWHDVAQFVGIKGDKGEQGVQGERGLKGDKGDTGERGTQGENGLQGDAGPKGDTGTHGEKGPQGVQGQQGERGSDGVFNIDLITQDQLKALHEKLTPLNNDQHWKYRSYIASGQTVRIPIADLNLILRVNRVSATAINYQFFPADSTKPAVYYVNRLSNYDLVAWESTVTSGWVAQPITNAGFVLDASGYLPGREHTDIEVIDPNTGIWYSIRMIGLGEGTMFFDVIKRAVHEREIIAPS